MSVISLNKHRKLNRRAEAKQRACENAVKFGRSALQKDQQRAKAGRDARRLDGHKK